MEPSESILNGVDNGNEKKKMWDDEYHQKVF